MDDGQTDFYKEFYENSALLPDLGLRLIELTGEDRVEWLQGQATNDLRKMVPASEATCFCLCQATGQIEAICDAWSDGSRLLIATDPEGARALLDRAEKMVILEDVAATDLSEEFSHHSLQGPNSGGFGSHLIGLFYDDNVWQNFKTRDEAKHGILAFRSHRLGLEGWDFWIRKGFHDPFGPTHVSLGGDRLQGGQEPMPTQVYEILRVEAGVPKRGADFTGKTLPPELGPAFEAKHVSYNKGCYMGQEVLMRIHSRGHTNRTWMGLALEEPVQIGATISHPSREDAGTVTSTAISRSFGPIATAILRNDAAVEGEEVWVGTVRGKVLTLPFGRP